VAGFSSFGDAKSNPDMLDLSRHHLRSLHGDFVEALVGAIEEVLQQHLMERPCGVAVSKDR
jgi:hypothetical protein